MLHNLFLLDMCIFSKLVIEYDHLKKATPFFIFMKDPTASRPSLGSRRQKFSPESSQ